MESTEVWVGKFKVVRRLGRGGMGTVYQGFDPALDRRVAIKTLTTEAISDEESRGRFEREARAAAKLQHPNIVTIYELGNFGRKEKPYIVMEYLEGSDLAALIGKGKLVPLGEALDITVQLCRALDFAHRHGVVHRDVKPANVRYLDDGRVKIMDFGIARMEGGAQITRSGVMVGTLHYMSPEQIRGEDIDGRSDVFSAGCILYEILAGKRPFQGESATSILYKIVNEDPTPLLKDYPDLPQELQDILDRALAKDSASRFQTAGEMAAELEKLEIIYRKSFPRPGAEIETQLAELESLSREGRWAEVVPIAEKLVEERPEMGLPQRRLRTALRELRREDKKRQQLPEERTRHLAEISQEFQGFYGPAQLPTVAEELEAPAAKPSPDVGEMKLSTKTGVPPERRSSSARVKATVAVLVIGVLAAVGWVVIPELLGPKWVAHSISISCSPSGSSVFVNGADSQVVTASDAPIELLVEGEEGEPVSIEIRHAGYVPFAEDLILGRESPPPFELSLKPLTRTLQVVTDPAGATLQLDGVELDGITPAEIELAIPEKHELVVSKSGYASETFEILPGGELPFGEIELAPIAKPGTLVVRSSYPLSLRSRQGSTLVGSSTSPSVKLAVGRHQITLYAPGVFLNRRVAVEISEDSTTALEAPLLGKVSVRASPGNCKLTVNGVTAEAPPFNNKDIVVGTHKFVFEWPDGQRDEQTHEVRPGHPAYVTGQVR